MKFKHIGWTCLCLLQSAVITLTSCTDDDVFGNGTTRPTKYLTFTTSIGPSESKALSRGSASNFVIEEEDWALTMNSGDVTQSRADILTSLNGCDAGIIGFNYNSDDKTKSPLAENNNIHFTFDQDYLSSAQGTSPIRWNSLTKDNLDIYAYSPITDIDGVLSVEGLTVDTSDSPSLTYKVPADVTKQKDIIVSKWSNPENDNTYKGQTIPLNFSHALSAIRFKVGFNCTVKSLTISGVYDTGKYDFDTADWIIDKTSTASYELNFGNGIDINDQNRDDYINNEDLTMILLPQILPDGAKITLNCTKDGADKKLTADISSLNWRQGKAIAFTLYDGRPPTIIYFDLALANVTIKPKNGKVMYSGKIFKDGKEVDVNDEYKPGDNYYVYQSTLENRASIWEGGMFNRPEYGTVKSPDGQQDWRDYIVNNTDVEKVIDAWNATSEDVLSGTGRMGTENRIEIVGNVRCNVTIDNIYSTYQDWRSRDRVTAGLSFIPEGSKAEVTVNILGDNRMGAVHYQNTDESNHIIFGGSGSLTVADVDGKKQSHGYNDSNPYYFGLESGESYMSNWWSSAIGGKDNPEGETSLGIVINSGRIFAGTTKAENCTAIGGGGNGKGTVTINGGVVTAVATTTGTAIGGGIGFTSTGGEGVVRITGGNVYAYNHANRWKIPSSAIGGAGSSEKNGHNGTVEITDGFVYAESYWGTAIGGGSSYSKQGGKAIITISGGDIIAKTRSKISTCIGGGTAYTRGGTSTGDEIFSGGEAKVTISGDPIIRTGSIGGGGTGDSRGFIGNATINVLGGDTQAQFILASGTDKNSKPTFTMTGGTIRNSDTRDTEYLHVQDNGGAVYLEDGTVDIQGGTITNCTADNGGAIYIKGSSNSAFIMSNGTIGKNKSLYDGGAIYMIDGIVTLEGGTISDNITVSGNGGGICINGGNLEMPKGSRAVLKANSAQEELSEDGNSLLGGNGGAIYISSVEKSVTAKILSGTISGNTSDNKGGGVCVDMSSSDKLSADVIIGYLNGPDNSPSIISNKTLMQGGGLYARGQNADITINSGTIDDNFVSQYVPNNDVANEEGLVTLNGGIVTHNVVTFHKNDGAENEYTETQKIVTSTNTLLVAPDPNSEQFHRTGYKLIGWNTQPNGSGDSYTDGQVMNITADIHLYARWATNVQ